MQSRPRAQAASRRPIRSSRFRADRSRASSSRSTESQSRSCNPARAATIERSAVEEDLSSPLLVRGEVGAILIAPGEVQPTAQSRRLFLHPDRGTRPDGAGEADTANYAIEDFAPRVGRVMIWRTENHAMSIKHLPASTSADDINAALGEDGAVVVDHVAMPEVMDQVAEELR